MKTIWNPVALATLLCLGLWSGLSMAEDDLVLDPKEKERAVVSAREKSALENFKDRQFDLVIKSLEPNLEASTSHGLTLLAKAYEAKGDFENQIRILGLVIAKEPNSYKAHFQLGLAHLKSGTDIEAVKSFRRTIELKPRYRAPYDELFKIFKRQGSNYESRELAKDMVKKFGRKPQYVIELCRTFSEDGYFSEALKYCQDSVKLAPTFPDSYIHLSMTHKGLGNRKDAGLWLNRATKRFPNSELVQWYAGDFYFQEKNYSLATRHLASAAKIDPKSERSQIGLARASFEAGDYAVSLEAFLAACQINPTHLQEFRSATAQLSQKNEITMNRRFSENIYKCREK